MTGRALRSIRLALSLSIPEFSVRIGIPANEIDAYERGEKPIDSTRLSTALERLAPDRKTDSLFVPSPAGTSRRDI